MTNAQQASYNSLKWVAGSAHSESGHLLIRVSEPEPMHEGAYASVLVKATVTDPSIRKVPGDPLGPGNYMVIEQTFLIEAGGCIARVLR